MQKEIWKVIPGYEDYQVSNLGNVKSFKIKKEGKLLSKTSCGRYFKVVLTKYKNKRTFRVHQLVAMAFLKHKPNGRYLVVDHIDNNPLNNNLNNLQIISTRDNLTKDRDFKGYTKVRDKYRVVVCLKGKAKHIGYFNTKEEAIKAYKKAINNEI